MGKWTSAWIVLTCCSLVTAASALSAGDYATAGRMHMSQWTATGLSHACEIFTRGIEDANCSDCRTSRELVFLRAMAKAAMLFIDYDEVLASDDLLELAEGFGVTLAANAFDGLRAQNLHEPIGPAALRPETDPNRARQVLAESILPQLESVVAELNSIEDAPEPFVMVVPPEETGLTGELEIDYGDVLILKGLFLAYKGVLETRIACDSEPYVYPGISALSGLAEPTGEGNLLVQWARRLAVPSTQGEDTHWLATVDQARLDWIDAITQYVDALEYIALENSPPGADPQEDELTYIDPSTVPHLDVYTSVLTTLRSSLQRDMADSQTILATRTYDVRDGDAASVGKLVLVFDGTRFEGRAGSLALADGDVLEVDWFGLLDSDSVGISLFSHDRCVEAWLQGAIDADRGMIVNASLDFWGADWHADEQAAAVESNPADTPSNAVSKTREVVLGRLWVPHRLDDWFTTTTYLTD
jgi:hypothetical protein